MSESNVDVTISVCKLQDIEVWSYAAPRIVENIDSETYVVIVPDDEVDSFIEFSPSEFTVLPESYFINDFIAEFMDKANDARSHRAGWYLQQLIKISALKYFSEYEKLLIWDADTIPLKNLKFFCNSKIFCYTSNEYNERYFDPIEILFGDRKIVDYSFIAQCFPIYGSMVKEFLYLIEKKTHNSWSLGLINSIDFSASSGFSEYETLGFFVTKYYSKMYDVKKSRWLRFGSRWIPMNILKYRLIRVSLGMFFDFIAYEKWDKPIYQVILFKIKTFVRNLINKFKHKFFVKSLDDFLEEYFSQNRKKIIVQIGANDGVQNDPLRKYLQTQGNYQAILVEPLNFYYEKLRALYGNREDIKVINAAAGATSFKKNLYYINPEVANSMNGDGPENNWAHGQGSFSYDNVVHWINENKFRGPEYVKNIEKYIDSIECVKIDVIKTSDLLPPNDNTLLLIDVQGFEIEVLEGIDWNNAPDYIVWEDDILSNEKKIEILLDKMEYKYYAGIADKVYIKKTRFGIK